MKEIITDSIRYWESRRPAFNVALVLIVVGTFVYHLPSPASELTWRPVAGLLLAAAVANILYCAAYPVDIIFQISEFQRAWKRRRWLLLVAGTVFAAACFLLHE